MSLFKKIANPSLKLPTLTIRQFYNCRNKVLIMRETGGLGDILMHRMMFEDFKLLIPEIKITFACLPQYHSAVVDHPFVDEVVHCKEVDASQYLASYNTTCACTRYESAKAPFSGLHRSDIWANQCGVRLTKHNMHIQISDENIKKAKATLEKLKKGHTGPVVMLCPVSAMIVKNLTEEQLKGTIKGLWDRGCFVFGCHTTPIKTLVDLKVPYVCQLSYPDLFAMIKVSDYVVTVDTGQFHAAGAIGRPLTGIFTFVDSRVYSRYYEAELVQKHRDNGDWPCGPCYNWGNCPKTKMTPKPCLTEITTEMIMNGVDRMLKRWPSNSIK